jgi:hypothetical protein
MAKFRLMAVFMGTGILVFGAGVGALAVGQDRPRNPVTERPPARAKAAADGDKSDAREHSVKASPPVVVRTLPQAGDTQVDAAAVTEIKVRFSKDMADKSWSWSQISDETFPKLNGKPHFEAV